MSVVEGAADTGVFEFDPYSLEVMTDPTPYYDLLREEHPMYYLEKYDMYFVSRFEDAWEMLSYTDDTFVVTEGQQPSVELLARHNDGPVPDVPHEPLTLINFQRSPIYDQLRLAHTRPLRPGAVRKMEDFIRRLANERLDLLLPRGRFDLTRDYAGMVAASVACHMFRLPMNEARYILDTVNDGSRTDPASGGSSVNLVVRMVERACEVVLPLVRARRKAGPDGSWPLMDSMFELEIEGRRLTDAEIAETVGVAVLIGATETVPKVVGHGLWELSRHPDQYATVRGDAAANSRDAWDEMVRLCTPGQRFSRTVNKPVTIGGVALRPGQRVTYVLTACARDPREYGADAAEFRWDRRPSRMINFGHGQRFCEGFHLANQEGPILVEEFLKRVPEFEVDVENAVRYPSSFQWSWNELPIRVPVAA